MNMNTNHHPTIQEFDKIYHSKSSNSQSVQGRLRFAPQGIGWKSLTGDLVTISTDNLIKLQWLRSVKRFQLRVKTSINNQTFKFDGFDKDDHDRVRDSIKSNFHLSLDHLDLSIKGWNWGKTEIDSDQLTFTVNNKTLFELPYSEIGNVNSGKNELAIEFAGVLDNNSHSSIKNFDQLVECRLYVPGMAEVTNGIGVDLEDGGELDENIEEKANNKQSAADYLCEVIKSKADLGIEKSDMIAAFKELAFLTPRGRYDVEMFKDFLRLRGKSYDYKIKYATIKRLFMLPKPDDLHVMFVIGLDPPLRQGQTQYRYLVVQFLRDQELTTELNLDPDVLAEQYSDTLQHNYDGPIYEVVTAIFNGLTHTKTQTIGEFKSTTGQVAIKCSYKANEGHLYAMDKQLLFVPKPTTCMPHADISHVTFSRVSSIASSRTIDMVVSMRAGLDIGLSNIAREEYTGLEIYLQRNGIKVRNALTDESVGALIPYLDDMDNDNDGGRAVGNSDHNNNSDEDESPDEDFVGSSSDSDVVEEEYASDYESSAAEDDDETSKSLSVRENEVLKRKKMKSSGSDSSSPGSKIKKARLA